jgi:hypothetical protein
MDTGFDPDEMETMKVEFLSKDYYELVRTHPELAAGFALGQRVVAMSNGIAYEVTPTSAVPDVPPAQIDQPADLSPTPVSVVIQPTQDVDQGITFAAPTDNPLDDPDLKPGMAPCSSMLLPLAILPLFAILVRRRR